LAIEGCRAGVGNSFWLAGHIGNKIGLCRPVTVSYDPIWFTSLVKKGFFAVHFLMFNNKKNYSLATLRSLTGRMWSAGRTMPRPVIEKSFSNILASSPGKHVARRLRVWDPSNWYYQILMLKFSFLLTLSECRITCNYALTQPYNFLNNRKRIKIFHKTFFQNMERM
jgi:hypothetical protein